LGRGAYKVVFKGIDNNTGNEVAWNTVQLSQLPLADQKRIAAEIEVLKGLNHKNILQFISAWKNSELN
jgi:WNK lysine deficient protein kinase